MGKKIEIAKELLEEYIERGYTGQEISKELGVDVQVVYVGMRMTRITVS